MAVDFDQKIWDKFVQDKGLRPSPDGAHDRILNNRFLKSDQLRDLLHQLHFSYRNMLSVKGWVNGELDISGRLLAQALAEVKTFEKQAQNQGHSPWWNRYKHPEEKGVVELVCGMSFHELTDPRDSDWDNPTRIRRVHQFSLELATRVGFLTPAIDLYQRFPDLSCPTSEIRLTPRLPHSSWNFQLGFMLWGTDISRPEEPFFARGISII